MTRRFCISLAVVLLCIGLSSSGSWAQWVKDGIPIGSADGSQSTAKITTDGASGAMVAWTDYRSFGDPDIYGNRVGANGYAYGGPGGVPICTAVGGQYLTGVIYNGAGAAILVWMDYRDGNQHIYAQKIDTIGNIYWPTDGEDVCPDATSWGGDSRIVSDGVGGAIIVWTDYRDGNADIYAQRVDGDGNVLWGSGGVGVCTYSGEQYYPEVAADGSGGAIVAWQDYRVGLDLYAQRVDADGNLLWDSDALLVCTSASNPNSMQIISASGGGAYLAWTDERYGYSNAFVTWLDQDGLPVWTSDGIPVCDDYGYYYYKYLPRLVEDGSGGAIVAWYDERSGEAYDIYAQRIDSEGNRAWNPLGTKLISAYSYEVAFSMVPDGSGGAIVGADIYRTVNDSWLDVYAQRVDRGGHLLWGPTGAAVSLAPNHQYTTVTVPDGLGGAIIAWEDYRPMNGYTDIYCQRMGPSGLWGNPEPHILSCADVPADEGGWVRLTAQASPLDVPGEYDSPIAGYNVWRMIAGGGGPIAASTSVPAIDRSKVLALLGNPATAKGVRVGGVDAISLGLPDGSWESVGFWFATRDTAYTIAAPTKNDSTEAGTPWETFIVTAHTATPGMFVTSAPADGYSVDNLAPGMTEGLAGEQSLSPAGLRITWSRNAASDTWKYNVHRGDGALFAPDESNLLGATTDLTMLDPGWASFYNYFYKLVAVDRHGNKGAESLLRPEDIKVGTMLQGFAASLAGEGVEITWTLTEAGAGVSFGVMRSADGADFAQLVSVPIERDGLSFTCVDVSCEPGTVYRYRVDVTDERGTRPLFETESISTPVMPLTLHQNAPNPFNPATTISFYLPRSAEVTLDVYDSAGSLVTRLLDRAERARGTHRVEWRGVDREGRSVSSGVYFYRLRAGRETISKKMVLVR